MTVKQESISTSIISLILTITVLILTTQISTIKSLRFNTTQTIHSVYISNHKQQLQNSTNSSSTNNLQTLTFNLKPSQQINSTILTLNSSFQITLSNTGLLNFKVLNNLTQFQIKHGISTPIKVNFTNSTIEIQNKIITVLQLLNLNLNSNISFQIAENYSGCIQNLTFNEDVFNYNSSFFVTDFEKSKLPLQNGDCSGELCGGKNCSGNGFCKDDGLRVSCECFKGFYGADCTNLCDEKSCLNNGSCVNGSCLCREGFLGQNCQIANCSLVKSCLHGNCQLNSMKTNWFCNCSENFIGNSCDICNPNYCFNSGDHICNTNSSLTSCDCSTTDYLGLRCQTKNFCTQCHKENTLNCSLNGDPNLQNNLTFTCQCKENYNGSFCESKIIFPTSNPNENQQNNTGTIIAIIISVIIGIILIVLIVFLVKKVVDKRREHGVYHPSRKELSKSNKHGMNLVIKKPLQERLI